MQFQSLFTESKGQPITYKGEIIQLGDKIPISSRQNIRMKIMSTNSKFIQGVMLRSKGVFFDGDQKIKNGINIWQDIAPHITEFKIESKDQILILFNAWKDERGGVFYGSMGAAMKVKVSDNVRTYYCNDGQQDEDFDDLIFSIELL